jgi:hypothetical protein
MLTPVLNLIEIRSLALSMKHMKRTNVDNFIVCVRLMETVLLSNFNSIYFPRKFSIKFICQFARMITRNTYDETVGSGMKLLE